MTNNKKLFVYSIKAQTLQFFSIVALSVIALLVLIAFIPTYEPSVVNTLYTETANVNFSKIKTNDDRVDFLEQFGWTVSETPVDEQKVTIPKEFDKILLSYNEFQRQMGLDLAKYKGKDVMRYTYEVTNYPEYEGRVYANVLIYRNKVIGGDICSADSKGFLQGFVKEK
ncbi:MAG: DUF4830 domain-containing protein [Clostridia bacterium]|nr:DUF4830 domain-containing protein [Clostridia bacterium]